MTIKLYLYFFILLVIVGCDMPCDKNTKGVPRVTAIVPLNIKATHEQIVKLAGEYGIIECSQFTLNTSEILPDDEYIKSQRFTDESIQRYLTYPDKTNDFLLKTQSSWYSEYQCYDKKVEFKADFIIHLEPINNESTEIEIFEITAIIIAGSKFGFDRHTGPGFMPDVKNVESTTEDRVELLNVLVNFVNISK
jgi:hypothetical protein